MLKKIIKETLFAALKLATMNKVNIEASTLDKSEYQKLTVKFNKELKLPTTSKIKTTDLNENLWLKSLFTKNSEWKIESIFDDESREILSSSEKNFNYYEITIPSRDIDMAIEMFNEGEIVESVQLDKYKIAKFEGPNENISTKNPLFSAQNYLKAAPLGIGIEDAWKLPGGKGQGIGFADIEWSWLLNHEDLVGQNITFLEGAYNTDSDTTHGTAVLGIIGMKDNNVGGIGIAHQFREGFVGNTNANFVTKAINKLKKGDAILFELAYVDSYGWYPMETNNAWFDVIREATDRGITIIEPAGNGGNSLDSYTDYNGKYILNRNSRDFRDSGAIMVGACESRLNSDNTHTQSGFSTYGSRIDVYAYGDSVVTTYSRVNNTSVTNLYTYGFNGTSSASPIITGAVMSIQGIQKSKTGNVFSPLEIRNIFQNSNNGTPIKHYNKIVGYMPNLKNIIGNAVDPDPNPDPNPDPILDDLINVEINISTKINKNKVMGINNVGSTLMINDKNNDLSQKFKLVFDKNKNAYQILNSGQPNNALTMKNDGTVYLYANSKTNNQYWSIEKQSDGYYVIKNMSNPDLVLDLSGSSTQNGTSIIAYYYHGYDNQRWSLDKITSSNTTIKLVQTGSRSDYKNITKQKFGPSAHQSCGIYKRSNDTIEIYVNTDTNQSVLPRYKIAPIPLEHYSYGPDPGKILQKGSNIISEGEGMIHLINESETTSIPAEVTINGGIKIPYFVLEKNTDQEWTSMVNSYPDAPAYELVGKSVIITGANDSLKKVTSPTQLLTTHDKSIAETNRVSGFDGSSPKHPIFNVFKHHMIQTKQDGYYMYAYNNHTAYSHEGIEYVVNYNNFTTDGWGPWHEIGHLYQTYIMDWSNLGETTNNIFSMSQQRFFGQKSRLEEDGKYTKAFEYLRSNNKNFYNIEDVLVSLVMFWQLDLAFGKEFYPKVFKAYRELNENEGNDYTKQQRFMQITTKISGMNLLPFFNMWGMNPSSDTINYINSLNLPMLNANIWEGTDSNPIIPDFDAGPDPDPTPDPDPEDLVNVDVHISTKLNNNKVMDIKYIVDSLIINSKSNENSQIFKFVFDNEKNAYQILNKSQVNNVLTISSDYSVFLYENMKLDAQYWIIEKQNNGYYIIKNMLDPESVLDLSGSDTQNGAAITLYPYHGGDNQIWSLNKIN